MGVGKFIGILTFLFLVYVGIGLFLAFGLNISPEVQRSEIILKMPVYLWDTIKTWLNTI